MPWVLAFEFLWCSGSTPLSVSSVQGQQWSRSHRATAKQGDGDVAPYEPIAAFGDGSYRF